MKKLISIFTCVLLLLFTVNAQQTKTDPEARIKELGIQLIKPTRTYCQLCKSRPRGKFGVLIRAWPR